MKLKFNKIKTSADSIKVRIDSNNVIEYSKNQFDDLLLNGIELDEFTLDTLGLITITGKEAHIPTYTSDQENLVAHCKQVDASWIEGDVVDFTKIQKDINYRIPSSLTSISSSLFSECDNLTEVTIPSNITSIGSNAFSYCPNLKRITFSSGLTDIEDNAFSNDTSLESVELPSTVKTLGETVFQYCTGLTDVVLSNSVTSIAYGMFSGCSSLKSVTLSNRLTSIPDELFNSCSSLTNISIPNSVKYIGDDAFKDCSSLETIELPSALVGLNVAFSGCNSLKTVIIPVLLDNYENYIDFLDTNDGGYNGFSCFSSCSALTDVYYRGTKLQFAKLVQIPSVAPSEDSSGNRILDDKDADDIDETELNTYVTNLFGNVTIHYEYNS